MDLTLEVEELEGHTIITCKGELDTYNCGQFRTTIVELIEKGSRNFIINLDDLEYVDNTGLGSLVGSLKRAREHGGDLLYCCNNPQLEKVFEITGLDGVFHHSKTIEETVNLIS